jgi:hypothetical protein
LEELSEVTTAKRVARMVSNWRLNGIIV